MNFKIAGYMIDDCILLICDGAMWHKANALIIPKQITLAFIPPYTPEMNPIEQIWKEIRKRGFRNEVFKTLEKVIDRLCDVIRELPASVIHNITGRQWIMSMFKMGNSIRAVLCTMWWGGKSV